MLVHMSLQRFQPIRDLELIPFVELLIALSFQRRTKVKTQTGTYFEEIKKYAQGGTCHVCIRGCACHVFGSEISLESHTFGSKIFKHECPIFWG